jgi:hypothetical protein
MLWQTQYCENAFTTKSNLHFSKIPIKILMTFISNIENPKFHLEAQKTSNSQGITEQKEQCQMYHNI